MLSTRPGRAAGQGRGAVTLAGTTPVRSGSILSRVSSQDGDLAPDDLYQACFLHLAWLQGRAASSVSGRRCWRPMAYWLQDG